MTGADGTLAFVDGDEQAFRRLVDACSPRLLSVAMAFADDLDEAHDLVQETWRLAFEKRSTFRSTGSVEGWLYAICRNVCLSALRSRATREAAAPAGPLGSGRPPASPDVYAEAADFRRGLQRALAGLPPRQREVVVLRLVEGRSVRETARLMQCAEGTVKSALHSAVKKLGVNLEVWSP